MLLKWPKSGFGHKISNYNRNVTIFRKKLQIYDTKLKTAQKFQKIFFQPYWNKMPIFEKREKLQSCGILICFESQKPYPPTKNGLNTEKWYNTSYGIEQRFRTRSWYG